MNKNKSNPKLKSKQPYFVILCFSAILGVFIAFTIWYYKPQHYSGNILFELEEGYRLDIATNNISLSSREDGTFTSQNNLYKKSGNSTTLNIRFELSAQKSFFKPEEFSGKLFIEGKEYISTFSVENSEEEPWLYSFPKSMSSELGSTAVYVPHDTGNWIQNFKAKLQGEKWIPFFALKDHENTKNIIIVDNLEELFKKDVDGESNLTIKMGKELYTIKDVILN